MFFSTAHKTHTVYIPYLLECTTECFPEIWGLNKGGGLKFAYEALNWTAPNWITLNQTLQSQTKACITKLSCELCALLGYYAVQSGSSLLMFQDNLFFPS